MVYVNINARKVYRMSHVKGFAVAKIYKYMFSAQTDPGADPASYAVGKS
jgi:hypothetical protein